MAIPLRLFQLPLSSTEICYAVIKSLLWNWPLASSLNFSLTLCPSSALKVTQPRKIPLTQANPNCYTSSLCFTYLNTFWLDEYLNDEHWQAYFQGGEYSKKQQPPYLRQKHKWYMTQLPETHVLFYSLSRSDTKYICTGVQRLFINVTGFLVHKWLYISTEHQILAEELE